MTEKTYIFAGASSRIAIETAKTLEANGHRVIGISTKSGIEGYDEFYKVENYEFGSFPPITKPISGLVYFPGTINLKPFNRLGSVDFIF